MNLHRASLCESVIYWIGGYLWYFNELVSEYNLFEDNSRKGKTSINRKEGK